MGQDAVMRYGHTSKNLFYELEGICIWKSRRISWLFLSVMFLFVSVGGILAQSELPADLKELGFNKAVSEWDEIELDYLVDLIVTETLTIQQSARIYDELTEKQLLKVGELLGGRVGVSLDEIQQIRSENRDKATTTTPCSSRYLWGCYPAEHGYVMQSPTYSSYHLANATECGSSDPDWLFKYSLDYSGDADSLGWLTYSNQIWWAIGILYSDFTLNSFNYSFNSPDKVYLVVGSGCVNLGGGVSNFDNNLLIGIQY